MKKVIYILVFIVLLGLLGSFIGMKIYQKINIEVVKSIDKIQAAQGIPVRIYTVKPETLIKTIDVSGTIEPVQKALVAAMVAERIVEIPVETGDAVKKGDVLVRLDDATANLDVATAEANAAHAAEQLRLLENGSRPEEIAQAKGTMEQAKAEMDRAEIEIARQNKLYDEEASTLKAVQDAEKAYQVAKAAYATAKAGYELAEQGPREEDIAIAKAQLKVARANVAVTKNALSKRTITAPFDGVVGRTFNQDGTLNLKEIGDIADFNQPIFKIVNLDEMYLDLDVSELYVPIVKIGMDVEIAVDALPGKTITGKIAEINPVANLQDRSYRTRILIDNHEHQVLSGMFARASLVIETIENGIAVPTDAVRVDGDQRYVLVMVKPKPKEKSEDEKDNDDIAEEADSEPVKLAVNVLQAERRDVKTNGNFGTMVMITEGLNVGDKVVTLSQGVQEGSLIIESGEEAFNF